MLDPRELCAIIGDPFAHEALYDIEKESIEPRLSIFKELEFKAKTEGAFCRLTHDPGGTLIAVFPKCTLSKIRLQCQRGGLTALSFSLTDTAALNESLPALISQLGNAAMIELRAYPIDAQTEIPLNTFGADETPAHGSKLQ